MEADIQTDLAREGTPIPHPGKTCGELGHAIRATTVVCIFATRISSDPNSFLEVDIYVHELGYPAIWRPKKKNSEVVVPPARRH